MSGWGTERVCVCVLGRDVGGVVEGGAGGGQEGVTKLFCTKLTHFRFLLECRKRSSRKSPSSVMHLKSSKVCDFDPQSHSLTLVFFFGELGGGGEELFVVVS